MSRDLLAINKLVIRYDKPCLETMCSCESEPAGFYRRLQAFIFQLERLYELIICQHDHALGLRSASLTSDEHLSCQGRWTSIS